MDSLPTNATVKRACRAILGGDVSAARAELRGGLSLTPSQFRALAGALRTGAAKYGDAVRQSAPNLSPFDLT